MAVWLNVFVRQAQYVGMANIAQSVNVISPLMTTSSGLVKQTTWWPLLLYSKYMRGSSLAVNLRAGEYTGETKPEWLRAAADTPWLDVSASIKDGWVTLAVVNIHPDKAFETDLKGVGGGEKKVFVVSGKDVNVVNTNGEEQVGIAETKWDGEGSFVFEKHSLTMLRWQV